MLDAKLRSWGGLMVGAEGWRQVFWEKQVGLRIQGLWKDSQGAAKDCACTYSTV